MLRIAVLFCLSVFIGSCNKDLVFSKYKSLEDASWSRSDTVVFSFTPGDTIVEHEVFLNIRNDNSYPFSNLFLIAALSFPDGHTVKDTLEYEMAAPDGQWLGKGLGSIRENKLWYKENIVFRQTGVYTLELTHAMRKNGRVEGLEELPGITDVGLEIEKSE